MASSSSQPASIHQLIGNSLSRSDGKQLMQFSGSDEEASQSFEADGSATGDALPPIHRIYFPCNAQYDLQQHNASVASGVAKTAQKQSTQPLSQEKSKLRFMQLCFVRENPLDQQDVPRLGNRESMERHLVVPKCDELLRTDLFGASDQAVAAQGKRSRQSKSSSTVGPSMLQQQLFQPLLIENDLMDQQAKANELLMRYSGHSRDSF